MKKMQALFAAAFILILFIPISFFDLKSTTNSRENRALSEKPRFIVDGKFNKKVSAEIENYINDRFGLREKFIALNEMTDKFGKSILITETAIQGKDDWIFFLGGGNAADFFKMNLLKQEELDRLIKNALSRKEFCERNGSKFILYICPNKHNVYPEKYVFKRPKGLSRGEQIYEALSNAGVEVVYPLKELLLAKGKIPNNIYLEKDSHWNYYGGKVGADCVIKSLQKLFPKVDFPNLDYDFKPRIEYRPGDLSASLGVAYGEQTWVEYFPKDKGQEKYDLELDTGNPLKDYKTNSKNQSLPKAQVFCDSFFQISAPFLAPMFSEMKCKYAKFDDYEKKIIVEEKPDLVIFEILERNIPCLFDDFSN